MNIMQLSQRSLFILFWALILSSLHIGMAQGTAFTYQGRLSDAGNPASGNYDMQFKLFDALVAGEQIGLPVTATVTVANGTFTVPLDFSAAAFNGAERYLEICVRPSGSPDPYTVLAPRQPFLSTPYAVKSLRAGQADIAVDSNYLGGIAANEYVTTASVGNTFIKNDETPQNANFSISGNGTLGGALTANTVTAQTTTGLFGLTHSDGTTTVSTYIGGSGSGAAGGWFGTVSNSPLHFFTNNGQPKMTILQNGDVGIGTFTPQAKLHVAGNAAQDRDKGGMVKAMLSVAADGTIVGCYNGVTGSSTGNCGFTVSADASGNYVVNLGFQVTDRFLSVTARGINGLIGVPPTPMSADYRFSSLPFANPNEVFIDTFRPDNGVTANNPFMLIVH